jgi:hypothetical protein
MKHNRLINQVLLTSIVGLVSTACNLLEPVEVADLNLQQSEQVVFQEHTRQICSALEDAGYIMPYGPPLAWYKFNILQRSLILAQSEQVLLSFPIDSPYLEIVVNWNISSNLETIPEAVSQQTVDKLAREAKNICKIVQQQTQLYGMDPINVKVSLRDLFVGYVIEYGSSPELAFTTDCDHLIGRFISKSIGLNPQGQTANRCPSLYVPN